MRPALFSRSLTGLRSISMTVGEDGSDFYSACYSQAGQLHAFLDGAWRASTSGKTVPIINPSTNQTAYQVQGGFEHVGRACSQRRAPPLIQHRPWDRHDAGEVAHCRTCAPPEPHRPRALRRLPPVRVHPASPSSR